MRKVPGSAYDKWKISVVICDSVRFTPKHISCGKYIACEIKKTRRKGKYKNIEAPKGAFI
jgi:hypothetical protein